MEPNGFEHAGVRPPAPFGARMVSLTAPGCSVATGGTGFVLAIFGLGAGRLLQTAKY